MKLTIYCGNPKPFVAIGVNQCNLLNFAFKYQTWNTYSKDRATVRAIGALNSKGCIVLNDFGQFKINL